ncbi:MAG: 2-amino-4-hydroxy-6-hydroxymethyldihydropteridine diphosphokinase [Kofleriaceae bacterium]
MSITGAGPVPDRALVVGLGGNLGTEAEIVARFVEVRRALASWGPSAASPVYRSSPVGGPDQPPYLNAALALQLPGTGDDLAVVELLDAMLAVERRLGRDRTSAAPLGPRTVDVDLLLWGPRVGAWPGPPALALPHPRLHLRRFVLAPLIDLLGEDVELPGVGATAIACWDALRTSGQVVERTRHVLDARAPTAN